MKNFAKLIFVILLMQYTVAEAQFQSGQSFVGGNFSTFFNDYKSKNMDSQGTNYSHNIGISWGSFVKDNKAVGWGINHNLRIYKLTDFNIDPKPIQEFGIGGERFWEFYKPLNDKFALYVRPSFGLNYNLQNTYQASNNDITYEAQSNKLTLGASLGAGIAWRITQKWALYGSVAIVNPIDVSGALNTTESFTEKNAAGENVKSRGLSFDYKFAPTIASGSIGLGFRYFCGMK